MLASLGVGGWSCFEWSTGVFLLPARLSFALLISFFVRPCAFLFFLPTRSLAFYSELRTEYGFSFYVGRVSASL